MFCTGCGMIGADARPNWRRMFALPVTPAAFDGEGVVWGSD
jgi:hypothetical protein